MEAFEENLQTFNTTIYGSEMKRALYSCFDLIISGIINYDNRISELRAKIEKLESEG